MSKPKKNPSQVKATLTLKIVYEREDGGPVDPEVCKDLLQALVNHAAGEGLITGDTELIAETWTSTVKVS